MNEIMIAAPPQKNAASSADCGSDVWMENNIH